MRLHTAAALAFLLAAPAPAAHAQGKWKEIGWTSSGNAVSIDPRSVKRSHGIVSVTVRLAYSTPVSTGSGPLASTVTKSMFDCAKRTMAVSESVMYSDAHDRKVLDRHVNRMPGYGPTLKGSPSEVALDYVCRK